MTDQKKTGSRSIFVTVVGGLDIVFVLLNVYIGFKRSGNLDDGMKVILAILIITAVGLFMHNRFGRIMAVITGSLFVGGGVFGLGQFGRLPDWYVLTTSATCVTIAVLHFVARARLAAEMASNKIESEPSA